MKRDFCKDCFMQIQKFISYLTIEVPIKWHYKEKTTVTKFYNKNPY